MSAAFIPGSQPPLLVGRERELAVLRQHLDAAMEGHGSLVLIGGEAGIGKTALAEVVCREADEQGALVLIGHCYDLTETPPYGPWVDLFGRYRPSSDLPPPPPPFAQRSTIGAVASQTELVTQVGDFLANLTAQQPLILLLEDLHWADPASLDLLRSLARTVSDYPLLVLAIYRVDEITRRHPLFSLIPLLLRESKADRLDVSRLTDDAIRTLVATRYHLPRIDEQRLVDYLQGRGDGNALFVVELLRALEEQDGLHYDDDGWACRDTSQVRVPLLLKQVIEGRVARLGEEVQRLLGVASVIGQEISIDLWATVSDVDEEALSAVVERAAEAHLVEETADGTHVRFVHALVRESLFEEILPSRRRRLHRQLAETLERLPAPDFDALAYHYLQAGDTRATRWLVVAGMRAFFSDALLSASERFEAALRLLEQQGRHAAERAWLLLYLATVHRWRDSRRSLHEMDEAVRLAAEVEDRALTAWLLRNHGLHHCRVGELRVGIEELLRGEELGRDIPTEERGWLHGFASPPTLSGDIVFHVYTAQVGGSPVEMLALAGRVTEACRRGEAVLADAAAYEIPQARQWMRRAALADTLGGLAVAYATLGRVAEARTAYQEARVRYTEHGNRVMVYRILANELRFVLVQYETERVAERQRLIAEAEQAWAGAIDVGANEPDAIIRLPVFRVESQWPRITEVIGAIARREARGPLVLFAYWQGDRELARNLIDELLPDGPATEPGDCVFLNALELQRVAAALALDAGDLEAARTWLAAHDRWLAWSGSVLGVADGQLAWAAFYRATGDADEARAYADRALVSASAPCQPLALIAAHRLRGALDTDAGQFADAAVHMNDALALADACAAPYERALTLVALAELYAATGQRDAAFSSLDEVRRIATPLHALPLLARSDALAAHLDAVKVTAPAYPAGLSEREVEVLRLIAAGRTNAEIAAALSISRYTVIHHVTHILAKTQTDNRVAAAAYALRHDLS